MRSFSATCAARRARAARRSLLLPNLRFSSSLVSSTAPPSRPPRRSPTPLLPPPFLGRSPDSGIARGRAERYNVPRTRSILPPRRSTLPVYTGYADGARSGPPRQSRRERTRHLLLPSLYILLASCSLTRTFPSLLLSRPDLLFLSPIILRLFFFSSLSLVLFFFFFFAVAVAAAPVSGSPQPAIAALVLRAVIRMFVREPVSLSTSSSRHVSTVSRFFSPPFPLRCHVASLVAVRTVRDSSIQDWCQDWSRQSYLRRRCLFASSAAIGPL